MIESGHPESFIFRTGAMCAVCGWECDPHDTVETADRDHAAFDPAHAALWSPDPTQP